MNLENIERLKAHLQSLPDGESDKTYRLMACYYLRHSICGTVGCIAGECWLVDNPGITDADFASFRVLQPDFHNYALDFLGMNPDYEYHIMPLFHVHKWPDDLVDQYEQCNTLKEEREVMIQAIDRFVEDSNQFH